MTPNIPLLRKAVEWVEEQEQLTEGRVWDQTAWFQTYSDYGALELAIAPYCGSAFCVAGKVALDAGWELLMETGVDVRKGRDVRRVDVVAAELMGLDLDDAGLLFEGHNKAADIRRLAEDFAGERL